MITISEEDDFLIFDCIIIGGGPAGLNAALVLGRANLDVLILDNGEPRNIVTNHSHGFITNDHLPPMEIRNKGYKDLLRYPKISKESDKVIEVIPQDVFLVNTEKNQFKAKRIVIASGLNETLPNIDGFKELYGKRFFNCPFCDGWEMADKKLAIIIENEDSILHFVTMISHWSKSIILFTNGLEISDSIKLKLERNDITFNTQMIKRMDSVDDKVKVDLANGNDILVDGGFVVPLLKPNLEFAEQLSIETNEKGRILIDDFGKTSHENVYAAGDNISTFGEQLVFAASSGSKVATGIVREIAFDNFI